jgi:hypothetical protein
MTWLGNKTRPARVTIGEGDYSTALVEFVVSDSSAQGAGIITCSGTLTLAQVAGGPNVRDLHGSLFPRGTTVLLDVGDGFDGWTRHPRGYLYVVASTFDVGANQISLEVGCQLYLRSLTDHVADLLHFTSITLDDQKQTFQGLSEALFAECSFLWQNKNGDIEHGSVFNGDSLLGAKAGGEWVSVGGSTAIEASPLGAATIQPDVLNVTYRWKHAIGASNEAVDYEEVFSEYFLEHPAEWMTEVNLNGVIALKVVKRTVPVTSLQTTEKHYSGPGGQLSYEKETRTGPAVELAGEYYADKFQQCRGAITWLEKRGDPNKGCEPGGLNQVMQSYSERFYSYGASGELKETVESQYRNALSCAVPANWKPGAKLEPATGLAVPVSWRDLPEERMYLHSRVTTRYSYFADRTVQETETWLSPCNCNNAGLDAGDINASVGSKRVERRTSRSKLANPPQPDRAPTTVLYKVENGEPLQDTRGVSYLSEAGPVILSIQIPVDLEGPADAAKLQAAAFLRYQRALLEGDARGLRISEPLRPEVLANYRPGMPFSYCDPIGGTVARLRMNATSWAVNGDESLFSTDGLFVGLSNGTLDPGSNIMGAEPVAPSIADETAVNDGRPLVVIASIGIAYGLTMAPPRVYIPAPTSVETSQAVGVRLGVTGQIVGPVGLLATTETGGLPLATNGSNLLTTSATIVDSDIFS